MRLTRAVAGFTLYAASVGISLITLTGGAAAEPGQITTGDSYSCALTATGVVKCWGNNFFGQLGDGTWTNARRPVRVKGLEKAKLIAAGSSHTCAISRSGGLYCWGHNTSGQLGDGTQESRPFPAPVFGLTEGVTSVVAGGSTTCALLKTGHVKCWGLGWYGQRGDGTLKKVRDKPVSVVGLPTKVIALAADGLRTCAVTEKKRVFCWGVDYGPLPVRVDLLRGRFNSVTLGGRHSCALREDGRAVCWGSNRYGELGGTPATEGSPVVVENLTGITAIRAARYITCALTAVGGAWCWGSNAKGALGDGSGQDQPRPSPVWELSEGVSEIASTSGVYGSHTCAKMTAGGVKCWGPGDEGQLGHGKRVDEEPIPVDVLDEF